MEVEKVKEEENEELSHSECFRWSSSLEHYTNDGDQEIYLEQADDGYDPDTRDIFDLTTKARHEDPSQDEKISIYYKDFDRIIRLLTKAQEAVKSGLCLVKEDD